MSDYYHFEEYEEYEEEYGEEWEYPYQQAAPAGSGGGCLPHMAIPPLAVVAISVILFFSLSNIRVAATAPLQEPAAEPDHSESERASAPSLGETQLAGFFAPAVRYWEEQILAWSKEFDLDPNLVATVMQIESCGDPQARSSAGAAGLFQVMPFHFSAGENAYDPPTNARRGLSYLLNSLKTHGDPRLALAGYNGGINGAKRPESYWPAETVRYTYWGEGIYADARQGKSHSARLEEWLGAGGASLCAQASQRLGVNQ